MPCADFCSVAPGAEAEFSVAIASALPFAEDREELFIMARNKFELSF
jgi:hypothetical protein